jgi:hypothetical protein
MNQIVELHQPSFLGKSENRLHLASQKMPMLEVGNT